MLDMYSLVENVAGYALLIWGLASLINKNITKSFFNSFTNIEKNEILIYLTASMLLILGLITVGVHNDWYWSFSIIVTILGWVLIIKCSLLLLFPTHVIKLAKKFSNLVLHAWFRWIYGAITIILALLILSRHYIESFTL